MPGKAVYFASPAAWRSWLAANHAKADEILVGFHKRHTARPTMTWSESVDEALCYGWIDGVRRSVDADRYTIRFTPRRPGSIWSLVNIRKVAELKKRKRMAAAGLKAFEARRGDRSGVYAFEQRKAATLPRAFLARFKANKTAWDFFCAQPPGYRRLMAFRVIDAKKEETRERRFLQLLAGCAQGRRMDLI